MHVWVQIGGWAHHHQVQTYWSDVHPNQINTETLQPETKKMTAYSPKATYRSSQRGNPFTNSALTQHGCLLSRPKEGAISTCLSWSVQGRLLPEGQGSHSWQGRAHPMGQGDKAEPRSGQISWVVGVWISGPWPGKGTAELEPSTPAAKLRQDCQGRTGRAGLRAQGWAEPEHLGWGWGEDPGGAGQGHWDLWVPSGPGQLHPFYPSCNTPKAFLLQSRGKEISYALPLGMVCAHLIARDGQFEHVVSVL